VFAWALARQVCNKQVLTDHFGRRACSALPDAFRHPHIALTIPWPQAVPHPTHLTMPSTAAPSTSSSVGTWRGGVLVPVGHESSIRYRICGSSHAGAAPRQGEGGHCDPMLVCVVNNHLQHISSRQLFYGLTLLCSSTHPVCWYAWLSHASPTYLAIREVQRPELPLELHMPALQGVQVHPQLTLTTLSHLGGTEATQHSRKTHASERSGMGAQVCIQICPCLSSVFAAPAVCYTRRLTNCC
jgi:hypothetical protein